MAKNLGKIMLENMILELERERQRFLDLISSTEKDLFGEKQDVIKTKLNMRLGAFDEAFDQVKDYRDAGDFAAAWQGIVRLRRDFLPQLSNEVLSVFGGLYIRTAKLDNICVVDPNIIEPLSFAEQAEALIQDLLGRSIGEWHSVLIVGEEKYAHTEAEIIRLRYPACDLWNLPYTAYEYGFLIALRRPSSLFDKLRQQLRLQVKPNSLADVQREMSLQCLLPQVQIHLEQYRGLRDEQEFARYASIHRKELDELATRQDAHLCRLFADAFATFFLGPAYIHTLLQFHFTSDENLHSSSMEMPAFTQRLVFALETLKWMHTKSQPFIESPFAEEVFEFPEMWNDILQSIGESDDYNITAEAFRGWLTQIHSGFETNPYNTPLAIEGTYKRWRAARLLASELTKPGLNTFELMPEDIPNNLLFVVLNAAWSARWKNPERLKIIESNALKLLLKEIEVVPKSHVEQSSSTKDPLADRSRPESKNEDAIAKIRSAIQKKEDFDLLRKFNALIAQGKWDDEELKGKIFVAVAEAQDAAAEQAFTTLWPKKKQ